MPWSVREQEGKFCVVKDDDGEVEGCHDSRAEALAQQSALYANEPTVTAALELDTNALFAEMFNEPAPPHQFKLEVGDNVQMLYSVVASLTSMTEQIVEAQHRQAETILAIAELAQRMSSDRNALTAAVTALTEVSEPVINVHVPETVVNVAVPEPVVTVNVPETVVNVAPPKVELTLEQPPTHKKLKITRDPLTNLLASAEIEEVSDGG